LRRHQVPAGSDLSTDEPEKQFVVAAGAGAKATMSAYRYLLEIQGVP